MGLLLVKVSPDCNVSIAFDDGCDVTGASIMFVSLIVFYCFNLATYEQRLHVLLGNGRFFKLKLCISTKARASDVPWLE